MIYLKNRMGTFLEFKTALLDSLNFATRNNKDQVYMFSETVEAIENAYTLVEIIIDVTMERSYENMFRILRASIPSVQQDNLLLNNFRIHPLNLFVETKVQ